MTAMTRKRKAPMWDSISRDEVKKLFAPAISSLTVDLNTVQTNAPINEKEGNKAQAAFERKNAESYQAAIDYLSQYESRIQS